MNSTVELIIVIVASIANFLLGFFTYSNNKASTTNKLFLLFAMLLALYGGTNYFSVYQNSDTSTLLLIRLVLVIALFINLVFFWLVYAFPNSSIKPKKWTVSTSIVVTILMVPLVLSSLVFKGVIEGTNQPEPGPAIPLFAVHTLLFLGGGIYLLIRKYRHSEGGVKNQIRLLMLGTFVLFVAILVTNMFFVLILSTTSFVSLLPIYTSIFAGTIAYAIVRHKLFNVKLIATQALTTVIGIILLSKVFVGQSQTELFVDSLVFIAVLVSGVLLVKSVRREVEQREQLEILTEKLKALDKQKDEFISMAAHELRAPLTAIKGYVSMIMDGDAGAVTDQTKDYLTDVASVNDRLVRLVNNMLNVGRIEEGRLIYKIEVVRLRDIVDSVFKSFRFEAERKSLKFSVDMDESIKDTVEVDGDRLNEVVGNFVSNAIKYTDSGEIVIHLTQPEAGMVRLAVKDTGPGVSKKEQEKLFQKFFRVESTAGKTIGTGLGLYISKLLINKFGGQIGINSEAGKGSEFWFTLPTTEKPLGEVREEKSEPMQTQPTQEAAAQDDK